MLLELKYVDRIGKFQLMSVCRTMLKERMFKNMSKNVSGYKQELRSATFK